MFYQVLLHKGLNLGLEKLGESTCTLKMPFPYLLTLLAPVTPIISCFTAVASLSCSVLGVGSRTHHSAQTQMWSKTISLPFICITHPSSHHLHRVIIQHKWISRCRVPFLNFPKIFFSKCCFIWRPEPRKILQVIDLASSLSYFRLPEADAQKKTNSFCHVTAIFYLLILHCTIPLILLTLQMSQEK